MTVVWCADPKCAGLAPDFPHAHPAAAGTADPFAALDHNAICAEHAALMRRRQALAELVADAERMAIGLADRAMRSRAAASALRLRAVIRYLREAERQVVARSWRH